jgi:RimJ/RimL family protein N-acetyltransferase
VRNTVLGTLDWRPSACRDTADTFADVSTSYPPLNVSVETPRLTLLGATDDLLYQLLPVVRAGIVSGTESPFDDPMSLYADSPEREWRWLRAIWKGRGAANPDSWRLYFVVVVDGEAVGMQDLIGEEFASFGTVTSFSWLKPGVRASGIGTEMRSAILHLAFAGLGAREASSEGFLDNAASNRVSQKAGYQPNGLNWASRRGEPAQLQKWTLTREAWESIRRDDITLSGVEECKAALGL